MSRSIACAVMVGAVVVGLTACSNATNGVPQDVVTMHGDYPAYSDIEAATDAADLVVKVEYESSRTVLLYPTESTSNDPRANPQLDVPTNDTAAIPPIVTTVNTVRVVQVLSGDAEVGDSLEVSQLGGKSGKTVYREQNTTPLSSIDGDTVLLLADNGSSKFDLINPSQGLFLVDADGGVTAGARAQPSEVLPVASVGEIEAAAES